MIQKIVRVAVCIVTYNQEQYISECIESVIEQETDFVVDIIVGNDCSTDNTLDVLQSLQKKHSNIILLTTSHNVGLVRNTLQVLRYIFKHDYTYVAMLDGDDYWCDKHKLQRQVALMETHPTMAFCYMRSTSNLSHIRQGEGTIHIEDMFAKIRHTAISNGTILHRAAYLQKVPFEKIVAQGLLSMDYPTNVYMARMGEVAFIDSVSLYWRRTGNTISSSRDKEKAFRYIEHEVRQGLFLASEFPHTAYDFSPKEAAAHRQWQRYEWALSHRDYAAIVECLHSPHMPITELMHRPEYTYLHHKMLFYLYINGIKKCKTIYRLLTNRLLKK